MCLSELCVISQHNNVFGDFVTQIAEFTGLKAWDYLAIILAIIAILISFKTYKSQKQTEENTKNLVIPITVQLVYFRDLIGTLIGVVSLIAGAKYVLREYDYRRVFSNSSFRSAISPTILTPNYNYLYVDTETCRNFSILIGATNRLSSLIDSFLVEQNREYITKKQIDNYLDQISGIASLLLRDIESIMIAIYCDDESDNKKTKNKKSKDEEMNPEKIRELLGESITDWIDTFLKLDLDPSYADRIKRIKITWNLGVLKYIKDDNKRSLYQQHITEYIKRVILSLELSSYPRGHGIDNE